MSKFEPVKFKKFANYSVKMLKLIQKLNLAWKTWQFEPNLAKEIRQFNQIFLVLPIPEIFEFTMITVPKSKSLSINPREVVTGDSTLDQNN